MCRVKTRSCAGLFEPLISLSGPISRPRGPFARAQAEREQISIVAGSKDDDFVRNMVTLLAEARGAVMVRDRQHVAFGNVSS